MGAAMLLVPKTITHPAEVHPTSALRCLWLSRMYPYPFSTGDRLYSALLAGALAEHGVQIRFLCLGAKQDSIPLPPLGSRLSIEAVGGGTRSYVRALVSRRPLVSARYETRAYRRALRQQLHRAGWDALVIDQIGMEWSLDQLV